MMCGVETSDFKVSTFSTTLRVSMAGAHLSHDSLLRYLESDSRAPTLKQQLCISMLYQSHGDKLAGKKFFVFSQHLSLYNSSHGFNLMENGLRKIKNFCSMLQTFGNVTPLSHQKQQLLKVVSQYLKATSIKTFPPCFPLFLADVKSLLDYQDTHNALCSCQIRVFDKDEHSHYLLFTLHANL